MDGKGNRAQWLAVVLCAILALALIYQHTELAAVREGEQALQDQLESASLACEAQSRQLKEAEERLTAAETALEAQKPLSFEAAGVQANAEERTLRVAVSAALPLEQEEVEFRAYPPSLEYQSYRWSCTAVRDQEGRYAGEVEIPLETEGALEFAARFYEDGRWHRIVLGRVDDIKALLPVRLSFADGSIHYDEKLHIFYWIEWEFQFENGSGEPACVEDLELCVYRNGRLEVENAARAREFQDGSYGDGEGTTQISCSPGDRIEFRLTYGDGSGLRYDTPIRWWEIGAGAYQAEDHAPASDWPALTWTE